jgi:hypothetical protein
MNKSKGHTFLSVQYLGFFTERQMHVPQKKVISDIKTNETKINK